MTSPAVLVDAGLVIMGPRAVTATLAVQPSFRAAAPSRDSKEDLMGAIRRRDVGVSAA